MWRVKAKQVTCHNNLMEKIIATILDEAHKQQIEETTVALEEGPENFYK